MAETTTINQFGSGVSMSCGFDLGAKTLMDSRCLVKDETELNAIPDIQRANGLLVWVQDETALYAWDAVSSSWIRNGAKGDKGDQGEKGEKGDKGDTGEAGAQGAAFTYADFTTDQLAALKGDKGDQGATGATGAQGEKGDKGDAFTYADFTTDQLAALKGEKGDTGAQGETGAKGDTGSAAHVTMTTTTDSDGTQHVYVKTWEGDDETAATTSPDLMGAVNNVASAIEEIMSTYTASASTTSE